MRSPTLVAETINPLETYAASTRKRDNHREAGSTILIHVRKHGLDVPTWWLGDAPDFGKTHAANMASLTASTAAGAAAIGKP